MSLQSAGQSVFVALGRSKQAMFFSLLRKAIINAPLTVILPIWMGTTGGVRRRGGVPADRRPGLFPDHVLHSSYRPLSRLHEGEELPTTPAGKKTEQPPIGGCSV